MEKYDCKKLLNKVTKVSFFGQNQNILLFQRLNQTISSKHKMTLFFEFM